MARTVQALSIHLLARHVESYRCHNHSHKFITAPVHWQDQLGARLLRFEKEINAGEARRDWEARSHSKWPSRGLSRRTPEARLLTLTAQTYSSASVRRAFDAAQMLGRVLDHEASTKGSEVRM